MNPGEEIKETRYVTLSAAKGLGRKAARFFGRFASPE
jgi:hypothetical protein